MIAAEWAVGEVFWAMLWFFLIFLWFWLVISIFADLIRSDLNGWLKAVWTLVIIVFPFAGILLYLIVYGRDMRERSMRDAKAMEDAQRAYIREAAGGDDPAEQLRKLADLHNEGKLSDDEYTAAKAKIVAA